MKKYFPLLSLLFAWVSFAQNQVTSSETASSMAFVAAPVSNYTGIPNISVPLFNIPTRSSKLALDISMGYHPSGIRVFEQAGLVGAGWTLFSGGTISRQLVGNPDEQEYSNGSSVNDDVYMFSFLGHSGRFYMQQAFDGTLVMKVLESTGDNLKITFDYNTATHIINSFTIFDDSGLKYVFDQRDQETKLIAPGQVDTYYYNYTSAYHLSQVIDNNNKELLHYNYAAYTAGPIIGPDHNYIDFPLSVYKKTKEIIIPGFGKLAFALNRDTSEAYVSGIEPTQLTLTDSFGQWVKEVQFVDRGVRFWNQEHTKYQSYGFAYKTIQPGENYTGMDKFGYPNIFPCLGNGTDLTAPSYCTLGVLEKVKLPTGGAVVYNWESNTYAKTTNAVPNTDLPSYEANPDNYNDINFSGKSFVPSDSHRFSFTVANAGRYMFYGSGETYSYRGSFLTPAFTIEGPGYTGVQPLPVNDCTGLGLTLQSGVYTINIVTEDNGLYGRGNISITNRQFSPTIPSLWLYGGGIRIKRIRQYDFDYLTDDFAAAGLPVPIQADPVMETSYSYNRFDNAQLSSGICLVDILDYTSEQLIHLPTQDFVGYKNVRVTQKGNNGWTDFTYSTPADFPAYTAATAPERVFFDYRRGQLLDKKAYRQDGVLLAEETFDYLRMGSTVYDDSQGDANLNAYLGWTRPISKRNLSYTSDLTAPIEANEQYTYDNTTRNLLAYTMTTTLGEALKKEFTYHTGNSIYSQNRISEIAQVRTYRGTDLLSTATTAYTNSWAAVYEGATVSTSNLSWLPQTMAAAKADKASIIGSRVTAYDQYGHAVEVQQENGTKIIYIYGYFISQIVAKVENPPSAGIPSQLINTVKTASDSGNEASLLTALNSLRAGLPDAMVTTYTYKPLIGLSTVTDPKGALNKYEYDTSGRLICVRNGRNKILTESEYNFRTSNP